MTNFLFLGGDSRLIYAAEKLNQRFDCFIYGHDKRENDSCSKVPHLREINKCKNLVLPLPASTDGIKINAPFANAPIPLDIIPEAVSKGGTLYCGRANDKLKAICEENDIELIDYLEREELAVMNAVPTAEGALEIILRESSKTIYSSKILLTGYGRITKVMAKHLTALGANVTVTARKFSDLSWAEIMGCSAVHISKLDGILGNFDFIINTVPAVLFTNDKVEKMGTDCIYIDLASSLGIEDKDFAEDRGIKVIWALSLPGKVAPVSAGYIIADTIVNIITEKFGV